MKKYKKCIKYINDYFDSEIIFNILIQKKNGLFIAHCLELDIVTASKAILNITKDMIELINIYVDYAIENDNLEHLYCPAPVEVWRDFGTLLKKNKNEKI